MSKLNNVPIAEKEKSIAISAEKHAARWQFIKERREEKIQLAEELQQLIEDYDLRFVHIRRPTYGRHVWQRLKNQKDTGDIEIYSPNGGYTVAFHHAKGSSLVRLSVVACSKKDVYNRLRGAVSAARNFSNGSTIEVMKFNKGMPAEELIMTMFSTIV
jgi:hypothetical protein